MSFTGSVKDYLLKGISSKGALLFILIDPLDHPSAESAISTAVAAAESGADAILVGGSIGVQGALLDPVVKGIKSKVSIPIIIFPGNVSTVSPHADALYYMSLVNSRNPYWITGAQMQSSLYLKKIGIESLGTAYLVAEPGGTVGYVGEANLVPRSKPMIAASYACMAEQLGFSFILIDSGSGAPSPVPPELVAAAAKSVKIPIIIGGGVKTKEHAVATIAAGASAIQVGTAVEGTGVEGVKSKVKELLEGIREGLAKRKK